MDTELRSQVERALSLGITPATILAGIREKGESEETIKAVEKFIMEWDATI